MLVAMKEIINPDVIINYDTAQNKLKLKEEGADSKIAELYIPVQLEDTGFNI